ncbi:MAG: hypothetical protein EXS37_00775 [Opitutus sp.]|nr:hypothetical protein [Opitutus sp.]
MTVPASRIPLIAAATAAVAAVVFAAFTGHMWEDYFITFRASLNLATGHGLVFQAGERVHTFTSPLGTLLPALFALGGGDDVAVRALWGFRLLSAAVLGRAIWLVAQALRRDGLAPLAVGAAGLAWALDPKTIDFSINGMETALLVFFIVVTWRGFIDGARLRWCALGFAGLQWTRPDGCVFFGTIAAGWLICGAPGGGTKWRARVWFLVRCGAIGTVAYLPWVLWAWSYYGSPIPHTILAKVSHHGPGELGHALLLYPWRLLFGSVALHDVFMPAYFFFGDWPPLLGWIARLIAVGAALAWLAPTLRPAARVASAAFFLGGFYVEYIPRSPWYYPGWLALAFIALAGLLDAALRAGGPLPRIARVAAGVFVLLQAGLLTAAAVQMRAQQAIIENAHRREIGLWLRAQAATGDRVFLEPLGYIGFFSNLKMLDYPGLASPEVVAARRAGHRSHAQIIAALRPEWIVLRPDQVSGIQAESPALLAEAYRLARTFDTRAAVDALPFMPGRGYLKFDAVYHVFARAPKS